MNIGKSRKLTAADFKLAVQVMVNAFFLDPLWVYSIASRTCHQMPG